MKKRKKSVLESLAELNNPKPSFEDPEDADSLGMAVVDVAEGIYDHSSDDDENVLAKMARKRGLRHKTAMDDMGAKYAARVVNRSDLHSSDEEDLDPFKGEEGEGLTGEENGDLEGLEEEEEEDEGDEEEQTMTMASKKQTKPSATTTQKPNSAMKKADTPGKSRSVMFSNDVTVHEEDEEEEDNEEEEEEEDDEGAFAGIQDEQRDAMLSTLEQLEEEDRTEEDVAVFKPSEVDEDMKQAMAVKRQKAFGDQCVNIRIRLQQPLSLFNRISHVNGSNPKAAGVAEQLKGILSDLVDLQMATRQPPEEKPALNTTADIWNFLEKDFAELEKQRKEVIEQWNTKLQVASGSGQTKAFKVLHQSVNAQIDQALMDEDKLIQRTQGSGKAEDVYDDTDFYQQMLREVMHGSHEDLSSEIDPDLLQLADVARRKSAKSKVDRRASKGRKVRYTVHSKLTHFMAPLPRPNQDRQDTFSELFANLFGQSSQAA